MIFCLNITKGGIVILLALIWSLIINSKSALNKSKYSNRAVIQKWLGKALSQRYCICDWVWENGLICTKLKFIGITATLVTWLFTQTKRMMDSWSCKIHISYFRSYVTHHTHTHTHAHTHARTHTHTQTHTPIRPGWCMIAHCIPCSVVFKWTE